MAPFSAFPSEMRWIIYIASAIEALDAELRRAVRARGHCRPDDTVLKLLFLFCAWKSPRREGAEGQAYRRPRGVRYRR